MHWNTFRETAPTLAHVAAARFARSGVAFLGTLRQDGSPRISPVEPLLAPEDLLLGLMWHSTKALDLLRDPRCTLHSAITSLEGTGGECKLDGRATEAADPVVLRLPGRCAVTAALPSSASTWRGGEPCLDVASA